MNEKKDWFIKVVTNYVGTEAYYIVDSATSQTAESFAEELARDNYESFGFDDDDGWGWVVEEYDPEKHDEYDPEYV